MERSTITLSDDAEEMVLDFPTEPRVRLRLDADETDMLIGALIDVRAKMKPAVAADLLDPGSRVRICNEGVWMLNWSPDGQTVALLILHPGTRWIGTVLDLEKAERLRNDLNRRLIPSLRKSQS